MTLGNNSTMTTKEKRSQDWNAAAKLQPLLTAQLWTISDQCLLSPTGTLLLTWIAAACQAGAGKTAAGDIVGLSVRTVQRWEKADSLRDGRLDAIHQPPNKRDDVMRQRILQVVNQTDYAALPANKIVPLLADKGVYIASESTFYRVLKTEKT